MTALDEHAFLRTIMDRPHDVGPRLVFADWLEERGDPWAELIRLQCELADTTTAGGKDYEQAYTKTRGGFPHYGSKTMRHLETCRRLLDKHAGEWIQRATSTIPISSDGLPIEYTACDGDLIWWRVAKIGSNELHKLFWWRGMPERLETQAYRWLMWHEDYMRHFPYWYLRLMMRPSGREDVVRQDSVLESVGRYAGRMLTTLDVPNWMPTNGFTAWTCNLLDAWGEAAMKHACQPFTLKIGRTVMGGPPHSAQERWQHYCDSFLKNSNVRIVSRPEARPAVELLDMAGIPPTQLENAAP